MGTITRPSVSVDRHLAESVRDRAHFQRHCSCCQFGPGSSGRGVSSWLQSIVNAELDRINVQAGPSDEDVSPDCVGPLCRFEEVQEEVQKCKLCAGGKGGQCQSSPALMEPTGQTLLSSSCRLSSPRRKYLLSSSQTGGRLDDTSAVCQHTHTLSAHDQRAYQQLLISLHHRALVTLSN